jgi:hypothetical protein
MDKLPQALALVVAVGSLTSGCIAIEPVTSQEEKGVPASCSNHHTVARYVAGITTTAAEQQEMKSFLGEFSRLKSQYVVLDRVSGDNLNNLYSNSYSRKAIQDEARKWPLSAATPAGIAKPFQRLHSIAKANDARGIPTQAYIYTSGTGDADTLAKIRAAADSLVGFPCFQVRVLGLDEAHRIAMAEALKPIGQNLRSASSNRREWKKLLG